MRCPACEELVPGPGITGEDGARWHPGCVEGVIGTAAIAGCPISLMQNRGAGFADLGVALDWLRERGLWPR